MTDEEMERKAPINIWPFYDAPQEWQDLFENGEDEDWIAVLDAGFDQPFFLEEGGRFGCFAVDRHVLSCGRTVLIGCHA